MAEEAMDERFLQTVADAGGILSNGKLLVKIGWL